VCRRFANEPIVADVAPDDRWDVPLRLLAALHYLALSEGADAWGDPVRVLTERGEWVRWFASEQGVQTNEVQRSWMLLPCFLEVARRAGADQIDLVELGSSAGLNLVWDRYRYRYANGTWGSRDAPLELGAEERRPVPRELLRVQPRVRGRVGIDRSPIDVTTEDGALLLKCFVWADQAARLERLDQAIGALRQDPPQLVHGDLVTLLPEVLAKRDDGALTVVYETAVLSYVSDEGRQEVFDTLDRAGAEGPLAFVRTAHPGEGRAEHYGISIRVWPHEREILLLAGYHGQWLEWRG
jgi:hypothetical protein